MGIYTWQQIEGFKENILELKTSYVENNRVSRCPTFPRNMSKRHQTKLEFSKKDGDFSILHNDIRCLNGVSTETLKRRFDEWLREVPDEPRINS